MVTLRLAILSVMCFFSNYSHAALNCVDSIAVKQVLSVLSENALSFRLQAMLRLAMSNQKFEESDLIASERFEVRAIRLQLRNADSGGVGCMARALYNLDKFGVVLEQEIGYTVEDSSDGIFVTVFGLD